MKNQINFIPLLLVLRFCVGDRFYLCDNKILCEYDYEERLVFAGFANIAHNPSTLQHIRRQVSNLQVKINNFLLPLILHKINITMIIESTFKKQQH